MSFMTIQILMEEAAALQAAALLARALTSVIASEAEYDQTLAAIQRLLRKGEAQLAPEEERLLELLSTLAENWEEAQHPIPEAPGQRILQHYMAVELALSQAAQLEPAVI